MEITMFEQLGLVLMGIALIIFGYFFTPIIWKRVRTLEIEYNSQNTSYKVFVLFKKKFWVEGDVEWPETIRANVFRLKLSKSRTYVLVKCNLRMGTYQYLFCEGGKLEMRNKWKEHLRTKKWPMSDFPDPKVLDATYWKMPQLRKKHGINNPVERSRTNASKAATGMP
jgi:hypothetical protein